MLYILYIIYIIYISMCIQKDMTDNIILGCVWTWCVFQNGANSIGKRIELVFFFRYPIFRQTDMNNYFRSHQLFQRFEIEPYVKLLVSPEIRLSEPDPWSWENRRHLWGIFQVNTLWLFHLAIEHHHL